MVVVQLVATASDHTGRGHRAVTLVLGDGEILPTLGVAFKQRDHAIAVETVKVVAGPASQIDHGANDVQQGDDPGNSLATSVVTWPGNDRWNACRLLKERALPPHAVLAMHLPVIGDIDNDGIFGLAACIDRIEEGADLIVTEADQAVVRRARAGNLLVGVVTCTEMGSQTLVGWMELSKVAGRNVRKVGVLRKVTIEVGLADNQREVGSDDRRAKCPGTFGARFALNVFHRASNDLVIILLIGRIAGTRLFDALPHRGATIFHAIVPARATHAS